MSTTHATWEILQNKAILQRISGVVPKTYQVAGFHLRLEYLAFHNVGQKQAEYTSLRLYRLDQVLAHTTGPYLVIIQVP